MPDDPSSPPATDTKTEPKADSSSAMVNVCFLDAFCEPISGLQYQLVTPDQVFKGTTDGEGKGTQHPVAPTASRL